MKRAAILSFSERGLETAKRIAASLDDYEVKLYAPRGGERSIVETLFREVDALIFIGACGIAVRAIAPYIVSKTSDPAVIVVDELGLHVISLLSGHIGGANQLARNIAASIGGEAVITTATDINHRFAVDEWAARNGAVISSMQDAKIFAAEILKRDLPFQTDFPIEGKLPASLYPGTEGTCGLVIACRRLRPYEMTLQLIPRILCLGIGCKRGTTVERIRAAVDLALANANLCPEAICSLASIDVKRDEAGLLAYAAECKLPISFYSAQELAAVKGEFSASAFVHSTVGVDNVCERSALQSAGDSAEIIVRKTCLDGVTVAVAQKKWSVCFE